MGPVIGSIRGENGIVNTLPNWPMPMLLPMPHLAAHNSEESLLADIERLVLL